MNFSVLVAQRFPQRHSQARINHPLHLLYPVFPAGPGRQTSRPDFKNRPPHQPILSRHHTTGQHIHSDRHRPRRRPHPEIHIRPCHHPRARPTLALPARTLVHHRIGQLHQWPHAEILRPAAPPVRRHLLSQEPGFPEWPHCRRRPDLLIPNHPGRCRTQNPRTKNRRNRPRHRLHPIRGLYSSRVTRPPFHRRPRRLPLVHRLADRLLLRKPHCLPLVRRHHAKMVHPTRITGDLSVLLWLKNDLRKKVLLKSQISDL